MESARLDPLPINPYLLIAMLIIIYIIGVLLKLVYYRKFHSKQPDLQLDEKDEKSEMNPQAPCNDTVDGGEKPEDSDLVLTASALPQRITSGVHKRTRNMAVNFYCE